LTRFCFRGGGANPEHKHKLIASAQRQR
jgi:hypothetical protein